MADDADATDLGHDVAVVCNLTCNTPSHIHTENPNHLYPFCKT